MDREQIERDVLRYLEGERPCEISIGAQQLQQQIQLVGDADEQSLHPVHPVLAQASESESEELVHHQASEELAHHQAQSQQPEQQPKQEQQQQDGPGFNLQPPNKKAKHIGMWTKLHLYNPLLDGRAERNPHYMRWLHRTPEQELEQQRVQQEREKRRALALEQERNRDSSDSEGWNPLPVPPLRKIERRPAQRPRKKFDTANRARIAPSPAIV